MKIRCERLTLGPETFPAECPNCLATPADTPVLIRTSRESMTWPHCALCAANARVLYRWQMLVQACLILGLGGLCILAPVVAFGGALSPGWTWPIAIGSGALIPLGYIAYFARKRRLPALLEAPALGSGVKLISVGRHLVGPGFALKAVLLNPGYADLFAELNAEHMIP